MNFEEKTVNKNYEFRGRIINVRCDDAVLPDGTPCKREIVEHGGGAAVLYIREGAVLLVKQFRYAYGEELYEIPAGKLEKGEDPALTAASFFSNEHCLARTGGGARQEGVDVFRKHVLFVAGTRARGQFFFVALARQDGEGGSVQGGQKFVRAFLFDRQYVEIQFAFQALAHEIFADPEDCRR